MVLTKSQKVDVMEQYKDMLEDSSHVFLLVQKGIDVPEINKMRRAIKQVDGKMQIVRKRLFMRVLEEKGYTGADVDKLDGTLFAVYSDTEDGYEPLQKVHDTNTLFKKKEDKGIAYVGGFTQKERRDAGYIETLATLPSKEELISKLLFLIKYPIQSLASVLDQIAEKGDVPSTTEDKKEEKKDNENGSQDDVKEESGKEDTKETPTKKDADDVEEKK